MRKRTAAIELERFKGGRNLVAQNEWNVPQAELLLFDSAGKTSPGWGFAFEITEVMKILNSVEERVKPTAKVLACKRKERRSKSQKRS